MHKYLFLAVVVLIAIVGLVCLWNSLQPTLEGVRSLNGAFGKP